MRIGFDFDNTIVNYDKIFHKVAQEQGVLDETVAVNKLAVRDHLRATHRENIWTEIQGYVYGARMSEAEAYPDALQVMQKLIAAGHCLSIISHKTQHPYLGKKYDLHASAKQWIEDYLCIQGIALISEEQIHFEVTKIDKLNCIVKSECDIFMDDLPEILLAPEFPKKTRRFLFDPEQHHVQLDKNNLTIISEWKAFEKSLL